MQLQSGDACPKCSAPMAGDQRYCTECGERRGEPRFSFMDGNAPAPQHQPAPPLQQLQPPYPPPTATQRNRWSSGIALVSSVGVLLLAMGVGVLIGNNGEGSVNTAASQPVILGAAPTAATGPTEAVADTSAKKDAEAAAASDAANAEATAKANGVKLAPKDIDIGDKCEKGSAGCDGGEFTGDFFE